MEDLTIAIHKDLAFCNPNKVGVESNAITRMTPTADIELTMTSAVVKPRAKFKKDTLTHLKQLLLDQDLYEQACRNQKASSK